MIVFPQGSDRVKMCFLNPGFSQDCDLRVLTQETRPRALVEAAALCGLRVVGPGCGRLDSEETKEVSNSSIWVCVSGAWVSVP